eukprot:gnl/Trimastix_PCT/4182.p1 GENE.gnl/Trimastix_PCT/4182~~gnl/Trimastix_PCT/4182.p1  ORF type:complete len:195 (+),score=16.31 gnl/Trimastix_PCT/4182:3-587(+)
MMYISHLNMSQPAFQRRIVVLGFPGVGKSAITLQYVEQRFVELYNPTIDDTYMKSVRYRGQNYNIYIMDTAGVNDRDYSKELQRYAVGYHCYLFVFAVNDERTFRQIRDIHERFINECGEERITQLLVGNKSDINHGRSVTTEEAQRLARDWGCGYLECSARNNENIDEIFLRLLADYEVANAAPKKKRKCIIL